MNKRTTLLMFFMIWPLLSGCAVGRAIMKGIEAYQLGQASAQLSDEEILATAEVLRRTAIAETQQATTATTTPMSTLSPDQTPEPTQIPPPAPTPVPIMWVRPKTTTALSGAWYRFYNKPGLVSESGTSQQQGGYYPGTSIWDDDSPDPFTQSGITAMGVIGSYDSENAPILPVIATASGDAFRQLIIEVYMEINDFNRLITETEGILHNWGHSQDIHAHLWPETDSSDQRSVIGYLEPGFAVSGDIPWLQLTILEITPDGGMIKVRITGVWMDSDDTEQVESE